MAQHFGVDRIFDDIIMCRHLGRPGFSAALDYAREGGIFVVPVPGRSLVDTIEALTTERTQRWTSDHTNDGATSF
ncbi:hypothetical protein [Rhodococcus erythropolis]|uniref:Uncharacterized protein n=1 Tax=Rhodococcus erythropolis TaxID=1833 RepID=A0A8I1A0E0_RHOER|nr:hypothetical protein [Rhodococcus erythropolis]MBH5146377.1 hypothetical protein [Rhodococcus erythropolis]